MWLGRNGTRVGKWGQIFGALALTIGLHASPWRSPPADLPLDPALHQGVLPNGLRYAIFPNHEPKDRVSLRLLVSVGSLYETERERGLAHFIEHMAFRGTKKYPRSTLVPALEKMGMGLGPDTAAFTSYDFTVYQLELPDRSAVTLKYGLDVLREFSENVTFAPEDIVTERGVVLSEMAARDTAGGRWNNHNLSFLWPGSRQALRNPVGTVATLDALRQKDFKAFYDAWYRPERMAVIVVGEVDPAQIETEIGQAFASLSPRGAARPEPADLRPLSSSESRVDYWTDPGFSGMGMVIEHPRPGGGWSGAARTERIRDALATAMLQRRLRDLTHQVAAAVAEASTEINYSVFGWSSAAISVSARTTSLHRAVTDAEQEFRRAFEYGFSAAELAEAKANYRSAVTQLVQSADTRSSGQVATDLADLLLDGEPFTTPQAAADIQLPVVEQTTAADCLAAFRQLWGSETPHILIAANPSLDFSQKLVAAIIAESRATAVQARPERRMAAFPYTDFGPAGRLVKRQHLDDLDITFGEFDNGVRLNLKPTKFEAHTINFSVRVGRGKQSMPALPSLDRLALFGFLLGGLNRCTSDELDSMLAGHPISLGFQVESDAFQFYGRCAPQDLKFTLDLVAAYLTDAGYRSEALTTVQGNAASAMSRLRTTSSGLVDYFAESYLTNFDPRFWPGSDRDLQQRNYFELSEWMQPELQSGAVEIALVGDLDVETAIQAVASTLGAVAKRPPPPAPNWRPVHYAPVHARFLLPGEASIRDNCVAVYWPAPGIAAVAQERRCDVLVRVLTERIMTRVRDELGSTYSPQVNFEFDDGFPGRSYFSVKVAVRRVYAARTEQIILDEAAALARSPVDPETFARAREPLLRERTDQLQKNDYWAYVVMSELQQHPERIENARSRDKDYPSITAQEVTTLAARFLRPENAYRFLTIQAPTRSPVGP